MAFLGQQKVSSEAVKQRIADVSDVFLRKGEWLRCGNGHGLARAVRDIRKTDLCRVEDFTEWMMAKPEPGDLIGCPCGSELLAAGPNTVQDSTTSPLTAVEECGCVTATCEHRPSPFAIDLLEMERAAWREIARITGISDLKRGASSATLPEPNYDAILLAARKRREAENGKDDDLRSRIASHLSRNYVREEALASAMSTPLDRRPCVGWRGGPIDE